MITIAHSPDADDRFMFWPLRTGLVKSSRTFSFVELDTQALNNLSSTGEPEVCAVSVAHYANLFQTYQPMKMGCSVGVGYGPVLVAPPSVKLTYQGLGASGREELARTHVLLSPGPQTTAHNVLEALGYTFSRTEFVPIAPMEQVFQRMAELHAQAVPVMALLIHEGRLLYKQFGQELILDIGEDWKKVTGGPLPLGMNVISRKLPESTREELAALFRESCAYALSHKEDFAKLCSNPKSAYYSPLSTEELLHYLSLYANDMTLSAPEEVRRSVEFLMRKVSQHNAVTLDWI